ncbi:MAG: carbon-nitrogen hydrolase family protein [Candidatus Hydrogenedentes bacterium]|nr:carbon-nitrogen hydrolase family protein [Candidatus Hydrogenedentota bacterium]
MATIRIAGVQMLVHSTKKDNLPRIVDHILKCDCDFILFPEMSLTGYNNEFSDSRTSEAWQQIAAACRNSYCTAIIGTGARNDGSAHIQSRIYDVHGDLLGTQEKLVPTEKDRQWCRPGEELRTFEDHGITFGCLNGNDLWVTPGFGPYPDPRLSCQLGQKGAQVIFHANHSGTDPQYRDYYEANLRLRAQEAGAYIVTVNAASAANKLNAPSGIMSPGGEWIIAAPLAGEHVFNFDLDLD